MGRPSRAFENVSQIQLMDGNQILHGKSIFLDIQHARSAEIYNAVPLE